MSRGRLARAWGVAEVRALAQAALPRPVFDFADGGAEDETTLADNEAAFARWRLVPRPLDGSPARDLSVELFGARLETPVIIGPTGLSGLFWPGGEAAAARAAAAAGAGFCLSHASTCRLEDLPRAAGAMRWMQVFVYRDRGFTEEFVRRAEAAGYDGLVLTIDNQLLGRRERDLRNGFTIPPAFRALDLAAMAAKAPWLLRMRADLRRITFANYTREGEAADLGALAGRMAGLLDPGMSWADVDWLRRIWKGPFLLKGVLSAAEAARAAEAGVDGVIVSNHGGRQLDGAIAGLDALPAVVEAVDGRAVTLMDGGIRRGSHVLKALALGARAVLIGRPQLWGLAVAGEAGVAHVLEIYRAEIDRALGLLGARSLGALGPGHLARI